MSVPYLLDLLGVGVFAVSGALAAGRKSLDLLGVVVIAALTAVGGGTIRDVLLDRHPIFWLQDARYLLVVLVASAATVLYARRWPPPHSLLLVADALGLGLFTISGARIAEAAGLPALSIVLLGTATGVAGGVLRDLLSAEIPLVLRRDIYATASIVGAAAYLVLQRIDVAPTVAALAGMAVVVGLRLAAILWQLHLPVFSLSTRDTGP